MIRLGLRLSISGGREAAIRLVVTAAAVALGVGLLLITVAGINAIHTQDVRSAWLNTSTHNARPSVNEATSDPLWGTANLDEFGNLTIDRVDLAATGPRSPVPPGIPRLPGAGGVTDGDVGALPGEPQRRGPADAARTAGHQGHPARECRAHGYLSPAPGDRPKAASASSDPRIR